MDPGALPVCAACGRQLATDQGDPWHNDRPTLVGLPGPFCRPCRITLDLRQVLGQLLLGSRLHQLLLSWFEAAVEWVLEVNSYAADAAEESWSRGRLEAQREREEEEEEEQAQWRERGWQEWRGWRP